MKRTAALLVALLAAASSVLAQRPPSGSSWQITYFVSGTTTRTQHSVDPNNNLITQQPTTYDLSSPAGQTTDPSAGMYVSEFAYTPTGSQTVVYTGGSAKTKMTVRTRVQWVSSNGTPAPSEVYLVLEGHADAADPTPATRGADDGLGHSATESPERPGRTTKSSGGKRYRKFKVGADGKVEIMTQLYAEVAMSGTGGSGTENCSLSVRTTDFGVSVTSDRDGTFRRLVKSGVVYQMSNYLEDDGVTARGGDGQGYGDAVATEPYSLNGYDRDFNSKFTLSTLGAWSNNTGVNLTSGATLNGGGPGAYIINCGYESITSTSSKPLKTFTVTGSANDPDHGISDSYVYNMNVHLQAEEEATLGTYADSDYLWWAKDIALFADYFADDASKYEPSHEVNTVENSTSNDISVNIKETDTVTSTNGWDHTVESGVELSNEIAKILYKDTFQTSGSLTHSITTEITNNAVIKPGRHIEIWNCPRGTLAKHLTSRYNDQGYSRDAHEYVLTGFYVRAKYWSRLNTSTTKVPHAADGGE